MKKNSKLKIVTVGGGTGGSIIDQALAKEFPNLSAIVTSFDNGGSSGILRREFGMLPQGDIRRRILAQKTFDNKILEEIYNFRFQEGGKRDSSLESHTVGNLLILAATKIWGEKKGIENICKLWGINGKVLPVTYDYAELAAKLTNGQRILGEDIVGQTVIDKRDKNDERKIEKIYLTRDTKINSQARQEIEKADYIILCPGDFYTSLIPNFLVKGFSEAIKKAKRKGAKIIYVANIMTKASETKDFKLGNFVSEVEKYLDSKVDYILYNKTKINKKLVNKYKKTENAVVVPNNLKQKDLRVLEVDMLKQNGNIRHDKELFLKEFKNLLEKEKLEKLFVFDLDDTLIRTTGFTNEEAKRNFKVFKVYPEALKVLKKLGKKKCILLTYDKYGYQSDKIKSLGIKKYFAQIFIVKSKIEKRKVLNDLKGSKEIYVVGDRHKEGELFHALDLGLRTICVAISGAHHLNKNHHHKYDLVIENQQDFYKILSMI